MQSQTSSLQATTVILFQQPYLTVEYDAANKLLIQNWKGFASSAQFREGIEKSIEIFKQKKPIRLLSNTKEGALVKKEDTDWAASYAIGQMIQHGLKSMAFVVPANVFAQMSVKNFSGQAAGTFQPQYFDNKEKAIEWLVNN